VNGHRPDDLASNSRKIDLKLTTFTVVHHAIHFGQAQEHEFIQVQTKDVVRTLRLERGGRTVVRACGRGVL